MRLNELSNSSSDAPITAKQREYANRILKTYPMRDIRRAILYFRRDDSPLGKEIQQLYRPLLYVIREKRIERRTQFIETMRDDAQEDETNAF